MQPSESSTNPESIYRQSEDKQRVVITGNQASIIRSMILHVLRTNAREADYVMPGPDQKGKTIKITVACLIIIEESKSPFGEISGYHHHIGVISDLDPSDEVVRNITQFAGATPKAGVLIFSGLEPTVSIVKTSKSDVTAISYTLPEHTVENGAVVLISGSGKRFAVRISGMDNLKSISAARELSLKLGVTSDQFHKSMTTFEG